MAEAAETTGNTLGDLFQEWTDWTGLAFSVGLIACAVLGLALSLNAFIVLFRRVAENPAQVEVPWGPLAGIMLAGMVSVVGVFYGVASLFWSPAS
jgi:hypothetical protein